MELEELTGQVIGCAIAVHRALGPGFLEGVYENALGLEMKAAGLAFERQVAVPVIYRKEQVGLHKLDLYVADTLVVELKAVESLEDVHFAIVKSYLRALGKQHGLLLNFAAARLEARRVLARKWEESKSPS